MRFHLYDSAHPYPQIERYGLISLVVGVALLLACIPGWIFAPESFYPAYLFAWVFWLGVSLGSLAVVMLHHMTGGEWGIFVRRFGEAAAMVLPLLLILFIPILFGMKVLYPWHPRNPEFINLFVQHRVTWFNPSLWTLRWIITMVIFIFWTGMLRNISLSHDRLPTLAKLERMRILSAPGMVIYFVVMSLAAVDWMLSRQPEGRSTVFGFIIIMGQSVSGLCLLIIMLGLVSSIPPFHGRVARNHFNDLGNLLLTCVILWAYCSFAQLLIIYLGNTQGEITWYMPRTHGPWHVLAALLIIFHFLVPFFLLLMRSIKRHVPAILWLCVGLLVMRVVDVFWITVPAGDDPNVPLPATLLALSIGSIVGVGGLWIACFLWILARHPLMPLNVRETTGPRVVEAPHGIDRGTEPGAVA